jgi:hypothetical protein
MPDPFIYRPRIIISGGQTGVDRAALDWAIAASIQHGGWCPRGRLAEDGPIAQVYRLTELQSTQYADRTRKNVDDSDATLILYGRKLEGGTLLTARYAERIGKPVCKVRLYGVRPTRKVRDWLEAIRPDRLNIAGPRASNHPKIYELAFDYLTEIFDKESTLF